MTKIEQLVKIFNEAVAEDKRTSARNSLRRARLSVARADGDEQAIADITAEDISQDEWWKAYQAMKAAAAALCEGLGVDPQDLKGAL